jgi:hypothetical protein
MLTQAAGPIEKLFPSSNGPQDTARDFVSGRVLQNPTREAEGFDGVRRGTLTEKVADSFCTNCPENVNEY